MTFAVSAQVVDTQSNQSFDATFERFPVRLGRNQLNDLHIDRPYVSQFHLAIEIASGQIVIKDLGSTNGTVYRGQRLARDQPCDITAHPEFQIGPVLIRLAKTEVRRSEAGTPRAASVLEIGTPAAATLLEQRSRKPTPGQEDPFIRQLEPYIEAYRAAWANVYRLVYEHLTRLQPDVRDNYLKRLLIEHSAVAHESDFQKVSRYYGVPAHDWGELTPPQAALAALEELYSQLVPDAPAPDDVPKVIGFARRLREVMEVFLKCFLSLRDGYEEFQIEVLRKERMEQQGNRVGMAKDNKELGGVLFAHDAAGGDNARALHDVFVEVMTHQVALINGVMEGAKQLLDTLSPVAVERKYDQKGKRGGLFSNKYEGLWEEYQTVHGDFQGEDKETFLLIFGPQFRDAYISTTGEAQTSGDQTGQASPLTMSASQTRR